jgi:hypothetical protein
MISVNDWNEGKALLGQETQTTRIDADKNGFALSAFISVHLWLRKVFGVLGSGRDLRRGLEKQAPPEAGKPLRATHEHR